MTLMLRVLLCLGVLAQVWCQGPGRPEAPGEPRNREPFDPGHPHHPEPFNPGHPGHPEPFHPRNWEPMRPGHGWPFSPNGPTIGEPHFCTTYFNTMVEEKTFPSCAPTVNCTSCFPGWSWWAWNRCDSCCDNVVIKNRVIQKTRQVCCPGYFGWNCDQAICSKPCMDPTTDCVAPEECGPACYPACRNGGSCVVNKPNNTCVCPNGWSGAACEIAKSCDDTPENSCQNGGTCFYGRCFCQFGFRGIFCETEVCVPACENGGKCIEQRCVCEAGFTGKACETPMDTAGLP